ncbi:transcriptional regulator ATRX [Hylaeus volcanicus]|uniref:transcriptional regulator ATRX n=1 Tax=Hylaeus volcanicus TaxID=313075 RepID=UPI0023B7AEC3|nr:transcriptional regulator ATRX [Hylaeus volcanicus]
MTPSKVDRPYRCQRYLVCFVVVILCVSVNARFHQESFKSDHDYPWTDHDISLDFASSEHSPSFSRFSDLRKRHLDFDSVEPFREPKEWFTASATKREPREDKSFKKMVSPFYTITEKDSQKYRDVVLKSGLPYCQKIKAKRPDKVVCYKCKNPKNGATYEQCSYMSSQPLSDSSNVEDVFSTPSSFRSKRSHPYKGSDGYRKRESPYRFSDRLFTDATDEVPAQYRNKDEKCEKVVKNSMVCMVCKDTKSNGKYEQCSYVGQPNEKKYAYTKSSALKNPERGGTKEEDIERSDREDAEESSEHSDRDYSATKPVREHSSPENDQPDRRTPEESKDSSENCKQVEKDSKTCTVCKNPKTGANYEKCSYTYEPDDKVYKYSRSKSIGNPRGSSEEDEDDDKGSRYQGTSSEKKQRSEPEEYSSDYSIPESFYEKRRSPESSLYFKDHEPSSSYRRTTPEDFKSTSEEDEDDFSGYEKSKSESAKVAKSIEPSNCKEVQKNSMTCTICKDPKTGSNSEQCSYKSQPTDKSFAYTRSKSFGSPTKTDDKSSEKSEKNKESLEPVYKQRTYGFSSEKEPYSTNSNPKREYREFVSPSVSESEAKEESTTKAAAKKIDADFYEAFKKKAEIQKVLQEFQKEDRSNCKKLMRNKMTCYQCTDEKGFQKEECAFIAADEAAEDKAESTESKDVQEPTKKMSRSTIIERRVGNVPLDSDASASENIHEKKKPAIQEEEELKEVEPYEYVAETKPVFDKILGITLPAFMLSTSEDEKEFDRAVASGRN